MKRNNILYMVLAIALALLVASCSSDPAGPGSVRVAINEGERTINPSVGLETVNYKVYAKSSPESSVIKEPKTIPASVKHAELTLEPGSWIIYVEALNGKDEIIGMGSAGVDVVSGQTISTSISVKETTGKGNLNFVFEHNEKLWKLEIEGEGGLKEQYELEPLPLSTENPAKMTAVKSLMLKNGFYFASLIDPSGAIMYTTAFRIADSAVTNVGVYWADGRIIESLLGEGHKVLPPIVNTSFTGEAWEGASLVFTVADPSSSFIYDWFLDGKKIEPNDNSYTVSSAIPGEHVLTVIASMFGVSSRTDYAFSVKEKLSFDVLVVPSLYGDVDWKAIETAYEEMNPDKDIVIKFDEGGLEGARAAIAEGSGPALVFDRPSDETVASFVADGLLKPFTNEFLLSPLSVSTTNNTIKKSVLRDMVKTNGEYMLPFLFSVRGGLFYDASKFSSPAYIGSYQAKDDTGKYILPHSVYEFRDLGTSALQDGKKLFTYSDDQAIKDLVSSFVLSSYDADARRFFEYGTLSSGAMKGLSDPAVFANGSGASDTLGNANGKVFPTKDEAIADFLAGNTLFIAAEKADFEGKTIPEGFVLSSMPYAGVQGYLDYLPLLIPESSRKSAAEAFVRFLYSSEGLSLIGRGNKFSAVASTNYTRGKVGEANWPSYGGMESLFYQSSVENNVLEKNMFKTITADNSMFLHAVIDGYKDLMIGKITGNAWIDAIGVEADKLAFENKDYTVSLLYDEGLPNDVVRAQAPMVYNCTMQWYLDGNPVNDGIYESFFYMPVEPLSWGSHTIWCEFKDDSTGIVIKSNELIYRVAPGISVMNVSSTDYSTLNATIEAPDVPVSATWHWFVGYEGEETTEIIGVDSSSCNVAGKKGTLTSTIHGYVTAEADGVTYRSRNFEFTPALDMKIQGSVKPGATVNASFELLSSYMDLSDPAYSFIWWIDANPQEGVTGPKLDITLNDQNEGDSLYVSCEVYYNHAYMMKAERNVFVLPNDFMISYYEDGSGIKNEGGINDEFRAYYGQALPNMKWYVDGKFVSEGVEGTFDFTGKDIGYGTHQVKATWSDNFGTYESNVLEYVIFEDLDILFESEGLLVATQKDPTSEPLPSDTVYNWSVKRLSFDSSVEDTPIAVENITSNGSKVRLPSSENAPAWYSVSLTVDIPGGRRARAITKNLGLANGATIDGTKSVAMFRNGSADIQYVLGSSPAVPYDMCWSLDEFSRGESYDPDNSITYSFTEFGGYTVSARIYPKGHMYEPEWRIELRTKVVVNPIEPVIKFVDSKGDEFESGPEAKSILGYSELSLSLSGLNMDSVKGLSLILHREYGGDLEIANKYQAIVPLDHEKLLYGAKRLSLCLIDDYDNRFYSDELNLSVEYPEDELVGTYTNNIEGLVCVYNTKKGPVRTGISQKRITSFERQDAKALVVDGYGNVLVESKLNNETVYEIYSAGGESEPCGFIDKNAWMVLTDNYGGNTYNLTVVFDIGDRCDYISFADDPSGKLDLMDTSLISSVDVTAFASAKGVKFIGRDMIFLGDLYKVENETIKMISMADYPGFVAVHYFGDGCIEAENGDLYTLTVIENADGTLKAKLDPILDKDGNVFSSHWTDPNKGHMKGWASVNSGGEKAIGWMNEACFVRVLDDGTYTLNDLPHHYEGKMLGIHVVEAENYKFIRGNKR